ncbi:MAG: bifunctional phosphopantothenoylcysteine decarboxylase/phosphopantothenate--cysteine ligase CoaBC [Oceanospirillaceae bacterium]|nr:bifunctional phosphopantothenoylcysteine decarboxylase/phosphopantothenate--cysteine ligase CoaBC [Oceanospirillaceae bacterium]|tara:strand:+ start:2231 stop:3505 length:1275 start_codon:yes stop_codon:yes gene_type:complete
MSNQVKTRVLLGITGGIAAYKSAELCRQLVKSGAEVQVVMTAGALEFITPLTMQAVSGNPVHHTLLDPAAEAGMGHIELARWADQILIAPATADFIARLNAGMANDLLTTLCLASDAPMTLAPAMNQQMWRNEITQNNIKSLHNLLGNRLRLIGPASGEQACGDVGPGRMTEPQDIATAFMSSPSASASGASSTIEQSDTNSSLAGLSVVLTAGPTRESIDPVRYISNHSSGKMGVALAEAASRCGAHVTLICGPVSIPMPEGVKIVSVTSAQDMLDAAVEQVSEADIFIAAAAVADYRPATQAEEKIKKSGDEISLTLVKNPDIIATIANHAERPFCVGFAAETRDLERYALGKLERKNLDMVIANDVSRSDIGFNSADNAVTVFSRHSDGAQQQAFDAMPKRQLADLLIEKIRQYYHQSRGE